MNFALFHKSVFFTQSNSCTWKYVFFLTQSNSCTWGEPDEPSSACTDGLVARVTTVCRAAGIEKRGFDSGFSQYNIRKSTFICDKESKGNNIRLLGQNEHPGRRRARSTALLHILCSRLSDIKKNPTSNRRHFHSDEKRFYFNLRSCRVSKKLTLHKRRKCEASLNWSDAFRQFHVDIQHKVQQRLLWAVTRRPRSHCDSPWKPSHQNDAWQSNGRTSSLFKETVHLENIVDVYPKPRMQRHRNVFFHDSHNCDISPLAMSVIFGYLACFLSSWSCDHIKSFSMLARRGVVMFFSRSTIVRFTLLQT